MPTRSRTEPVLLEPLPHVLRVSAVTAALTPDVESLYRNAAEGANSHDTAPTAQPVVENRAFTAYFVARAAPRAHCGYHVLRVQHLHVGNRSGSDLVV